MIIIIFRVKYMGTIRYCTTHIEASFMKEHEATRSQPRQCLCKQTMHFSVTQVHKKTVGEYYVITTNTQYADVNNICNFTKY